MLNRKLITIIIIAYIASSCICTRKNKNVTIIGHRGVASLAPENTLAAIDSAVTNNLIFTEVDVRRTKDNVLILMHDKNLKRTTNGKGAIKKRNYSDIQKLSIRHKFKNITTDIKIPTLDTVLNYIRNKEINLIIELKEPKEYPGIEKQVAKLVEKYNLNKKVIVASFDQKSLTAIKNINPEIKTGIFTIFPTNNKTEDAEFVGVYWPSVYLTPWLIKNLQNKNIHVWVWTVNSVNVARNLSHKGIDGIISNDPFILSH